MKDECVLITGGAGFIGSNLANRLAEDNEVLAIDDGTLGIPENLEEDVDLHRRSVLDDDLPTKVTIVYHFAGISGYTDNERNPTRSARVNIEGFINVVDQAMQSDCDTVVFASDSSIYGDQTRPVTEKTETRINTANKASKISREKYAEYFADHYGLNMIGIRLFTVYQEYGAMERTGKYANLVAQYADDIAYGRQPILYGDGTQTRDFTHMDDIVRGLIAVGQRKPTGIYNLGSGQAISLNELVSLIADELGVNADPEYVENPTPEDISPYNPIADYSKINEVVGWEPEISLKNGIRRVCAYYDQSESFEEEKA